MFKTFSSYNFAEEKECKEFFNSQLSERDRNQERIYHVRDNITLAIIPFTNQFFYWTLVLLILHHFNFKKPVTKLITLHFILRTIGDMLDSYGSRYTNYYHKVDGVCVKDYVDIAEHHPLRWVISRQLAGIFWYSGEIVADWYPLLRTKAVAEQKKEVWYIYAACFIYNLSKIAMMFYHFTIDGYQINEREHEFYNGYWIIYLICLCCSLLYDITVYSVMKHAIFRDTKSINFGFLRKFRSMSEYRMLIMAIIGFIGIPIMSTSVILGLKFDNYDWSVESLRIFIVNISYYIMFIDQLMLFTFTSDKSTANSGKNDTNFQNSNYSDYRYQNLKY